MVGVKVNFLPDRYPVISVTVSYKSLPLVTESFRNLCCKADEQVCMGIFSDSMCSAPICYLCTVCPLILLFLCKLVSAILSALNFHISFESACQFLQNKA